MNNLSQFMIFLKNFALGITIPVTNLILLESGASLQTLPLLISLFSLTVLAMELPSGIGADLWGGNEFSS